MSCRACLEYLKVTGQQPDIIHAHEWQLCAVPMLYWCAVACSEAAMSTEEVLGTFDWCMPALHSAYSFGLCCIFCNEFTVA